MKIKFIPNNLLNHICGEVNTNTDFELMDEFGFNLHKRKIIRFGFYSFRKLLLVIFVPSFLTAAENYIFE